MFFFLGGGFKYFLFSSLFGEDSHFDSYFSDGLKQPTSSVFLFVCVFVTVRVYSLSFGDVKFLEKKRLWRHKS